MYINSFIFQQQEKIIAKVLKASKFVFRSKGSSKEAPKPLYVMGSTNVIEYLANFSLLFSSDVL